MHRVGLALVLAAATLLAACDQPFLVNPVNQPASDPANQPANGVGTQTPATLGGDSTGDESPTAFETVTQTGSNSVYSGPTADNDQFGWWDVIDPYGEDTTTISPAEESEDVAEHVESLLFMDESPDSELHVVRGPDEGESVFAGLAGGNRLEDIWWYSEHRSADWSHSEDVTVYADLTGRLTAVYLPGMVYNPDMLLPLRDVGDHVEVAGSVTMASGIAWNYTVDATVASAEFTGEQGSLTLHIRTFGAAGAMAWDMSGMHVTTYAVGGDSIDYASFKPYLGDWDFPASDDPIFPLRVSQAFKLSGTLTRQ